ncbi:MAG: sensor histidine kinase [Trebonia sp.]
MRALRPTGYPAARTAGRWVSDVLLTLLALVTTLPALPRDSTRMHAAEVVVLAISVAPLLVRRIWPLPVFGWILLTAIAAGLWSKSAIDGLALLIALYTVASMRPRKEALVCAGLLEVVAVIALLLYANSRWWFDAIFVSGMVAAALGLGLYFAARRAYLAELQDRAERLERERDQQAALAAAAERARIAREMHDVVAHHLTVMTTLAEAAVAASASSPEKATDVMRTVAVTGRRALADTRRLLGVLRERDGTGAGSAEALQPVPDLSQLDALIEQVRSAGLDTALELHGQAPDVPAGVQLAVYRLVQEALTNTLKHGGAGARACVRLSFEPGELRVDVNDDGAGSAAPAAAGVGGGLPGMRERVRAYGGDVQAGPRQTAGWAVTARLPLDNGGTI